MTVDYIQKKVTPNLRRLKVDVMLDNYVNGNISDARRLSKYMSYNDIGKAIVKRGIAKTATGVLAVMNFLKTGDGYQEACDAK